MKRSIVDRSLDIHYRISGEYTGLCRLFNTLIDRLNKFLWNDTSLDFIKKFIALADFIRLETDPTMTILTTSTGLANIFPFRFGQNTDGLTIGHLWSPHIHFHFELTLHTIDNDVEMQFAHSRKNGLGRFFVCMHPESWVFFE